MAVGITIHFVRSGMGHRYVYVSPTPLVLLRSIVVLAILC